MPLVRRGCALLLVGAVGLAARAGERSTPSPSPVDDVLALVDGRPVTRRDLVSRADPHLIEARTRQYELEGLALDALIEERLLHDEARRRGTTVEALLRAEVEARAAPAGPWDEEAYQHAHPRTFAGMTPADARRAAGEAVRSDRRTQRRIGFLNELRAAAGVRVMLEPPRVAVDAGRGATRGPTDARVTLVEFADFQCPYCRGLAASLKRIEERHPRGVRLAFRHFPLDSHAQAAKAAEASECARDQGRFWEMHDRLFEPRARLEPNRLKDHARALGLDAAAFDRCLDGGGKAERWREDRRAAEGLGLSATPMLFVNGRLVVGARPDAELLRIVEEELRNHSERSEGSAVPR